MGKKMAGSRSMTLILVIFSMLRPMGTKRREPTAPISVAEADELAELLGGPPL